VSDCFIPKAYVVRRAYDSAAQQVELLPGLRHNFPMKSTKSFKKQAEKAEAVAHRSEDTEHAERMHDLAEAFRAQAEALKAEKKKRKVRK